MADDAPSGLAALFEAPTIWPAGLRIGEMVSETKIFLPSLRRRIVSNGGTLWPLFIRAMISSSSLRSRSGISMRMDRPIASSAV